MTPNEATAGVIPVSRGGLDTPRSRLEQMQAAQAQAAAQVPERIMQAMLLACGQLGYRQVSVRHVLERYGGYRVQFYRHFDNKADCYAAAYEAEIERLARLLLDAAKAEPTWSGGLRAALFELARYVTERPQLAKGLLIEVHVAGGAALAKREHVIQRFARALDSARREVRSGQPVPPPKTALFMISAIEEAVCAHLAVDDLAGLAKVMPEMAQLVIDAYFGTATSEQAAATSEQALAGASASRV